MVYGGPERYCRVKDSLSDNQLEWLWEALTTEPTIQREFGARILYREDEWKSQNPVPVLNSGHVLGVFLKSFTSFGWPVLQVPAQVQPDGWITLLSILMMAPGKSKSFRFECRDLKAAIEARVPTASSLEEEAVLMKLESKDISVKGGILTGTVRSLNHAFTVISRRLQPNRRGHGGRIYDHIALRQNDKSIPLEDIRCEVEAGKWKVP